VPMASTRASRPLHEQEGPGTNKSVRNTREAFRQQSTQDYRTPHGGRSETVHHRQYYRSAPYGSPFISPPFNSKRRPRSSHSRTSDARKPRPEPLVLDPSASKSLPGHLGACNSEHRRVTISDGRTNSSTVQTLFQVAAQGLREHHATAALYSEGSLNLHATPTAIDRTTTAAIFARSSGVVQAGFLQKLGENIPEFKRRFFVLKPETSLYYYLSPNETEPRGKINLEGSTIEQLEETPDGRLRFVVSWKSDNSDGDRSNTDENKEFVLEARSTEIGEEWIQHMKGERVSYLKDKNETLTSTVTKQVNEIADLERQIEHFRMIEKDRDGALEDAKNWKNKFHRLDEALRLLTQQIRKSLSMSFTKEGECNEDGKNTAEREAVDETDETENSADNDNETLDSAKSVSKGNDESSHLPESKKDTTPVKKNLAPALLDDLAQEDMDVEEIMDVPGTYFSGLSNACKQQKESSRLASIEASSAVDDVLQANEKVEVIQKRMNKAEKQILKLWEENCDIRNKLKQKKREKRVLVKEVKQLQHTVQALEQNLKQASATPSIMPNKTINEDGPMEDSMIGSDEERLIIELEEHVASSIRLHERLLGNNVDRDMEQSISIDLASIAKEQVPNGNLDSKFRQIELEGSKAKQVSLFDDESDSDDESSVQHQDYEDMNSRIENQSLFGSVASSALSFADSDLRSPPRGNPLLELEEDSEPEHRLLKPSSSKLVTENGQANSRLVCPLADVVDVSGRSGNGEVLSEKGNEDLRVHHLTFYSQKIGIQFQKAAPAPTKPRGLLTDAVTADLVEKLDDSDKTAAELRSVANFTSLAHGGIIKKKKESKSSKSAPVDIVLVCGFEGFDDSGANQRPKLGARLVAFDGISVEVGKWTFEKIRKAIKSRGRPLTLSFRNDFLTTDQRATLTQAIKDVDAKRDPVHRKLEYERPPSTTQSLSSAPSFESGHFLNNNDTNNRVQGVHRTGEYTTFKSLDISATATEESNCWNHCPASSASSISSAQPPHSARSSEAGSTRSMSSLMKILVRKGSTSSDLEPGSEPSLKGTKSRDEGSKRNRMFDGGVNPSGTRQHQDFEANLL